MDLEQEISKALADPEIMNKVQGVLSSLSENGEGESADALPLPDKNILSALSKSGGDDRTRLLLALKPFLSEKRAPYMDSAVTILRLASMGKLGKDLKLF